MVPLLTRQHALPRRRTDWYLSLIVALSGLSHGYGIDWAVWLCWLLALFMIVNAVVNAIGPKPMRDGFARWGFPWWWRFVNAAVLLFSGLLMLFEATRVWGLLLGLTECAAIWSLCSDTRITTICRQAWYLPGRLAWHSGEPWLTRGKTQTLGVFM